LRSNIADAVQRSGFPPVHLAEINFEALFQQRLAEQQAQAGAAGNGSGIILPH
jgi:preprotein translocase subunit SecB